MADISIKNRGFQIETASAIFIIVFVSLFILANFVVGFVLPLFIISMTISGLIAFLYPRSGIYAIIFLTFIFERFFTLQPILMGRNEYKLYPLDIIFIAVLLGTLIYAVLGKITIKLKRADYFLIGFIPLTFAYFAGSVGILNADFALSFSSFKNYAFYSLFYFAIILLINSQEYWQRFLKFVFAGAVGIIFFIFYGIIAGQGLWSEFTPLSTEGVRTLAFTHAFYLSIVLIGTLVYLIFQRNNPAKGWYFLMALWVIGIVGSMMRHLWIGLAVALFALYLFITKEQKDKFQKIAVSYGIAIIIAIILLGYTISLFPNSAIQEGSNNVSNVLSHRFSSVFSASADESFSWRSVAWKEALKEYAQNPIFGIGLGKKLYLEIENYRDFVEVRNIHNSPLVLFVQMGLVTFLVFLVFIYQNVKSILPILKDNWANTALAILLLFYLIVFMFQPYLEANLLGIFFWIIIGLMRVSSDIKEKTKI